MPAEAASAENLDHLAHLGLIERGDGHGLRGGNVNETGAGDEGSRD
jgi:hypothetical protein